MGHSVSAYDFNIDGDKWVTTEASSVLFFIKMGHKMRLKFCMKHFHMITFINIETLLNFEVISEKINISEYVGICSY